MTEKAIFGEGCFWCTEAIFSQLKGVSKVTPGYAGGETKNPSYDMVCSGNTGHAEVIQIEFDPGIISYKELLEMFFNTHDPTTLNRQGNDAGTQYRSIILYTSKEQKEKIETAISAIGPAFKNPIVTEVKKLDRFYPAEEYHHQYFKKNPDKAYCQFVISPKVGKFLNKYPDKII